MSLSNPAKPASRFLKAWRKVSLVLAIGFGSGALHAANVTVVISGLGGSEDFTERFDEYATCLLYTSPSPRDRTRSRMPSSA